jgi:signal transduction histidine kinase
MEDAMEMERQFVADISHDLKTPITVVLANSSIIRSDPDARVSEQEQWLDSTDAAARNMMDMVERMLTLSSLESAGASVERIPLSLSAAAEKCALQLESLAYDRGVEIKTDIEPGVSVMATAECAEKICGGLVENALKYEKPGGCVTVKVEKGKKNSLLRVENAGSVIDEKDLPHIFERFYRGDKSRTESRGHGLGLPIVKSAAELIGARISVKSDAETGTAFTVSFDNAE